MGKLGGTMRTQWVKKYDDLWWGPCGFVVTKDSGTAYGDCYVVRVNSKELQFCKTLKSAKEYVQSFIDQCATYAAWQKRGGRDA